MQKLDKKMGWRVSRNQMKSYSNKKTTRRIRVPYSQATGEFARLSKATAASSSFTCIALVSSCSVKFRISALLVSGRCDRKCCHS
jgi:hypothetical protein